MIIKLITLLFGRLSHKQKEELLSLLTALVKAAAAGATEGLSKKAV